MYNLKETNAVLIQSSFNKLSFPIISCMKFITYIARVLLVVIFCLSLAGPTQASTFDEMSQTLRIIQQQLNAYTASLQGGHVLGVSTIVVHNDTELANALKAVTGGETVQLAPGNYGAINIQIPYNRLQVGAIYLSNGAPMLTSPVTVTSADSNNRAVVSSIRIEGTPYWHITNLSFRPDAKKTAVDIKADAILVQGNDISFGDSTSWGQTEWTNYPGNGISVGGNNVEVSNNYLLNVDFGIIGGYVTNTYVHNNKIVNFKGDAFRGLGDGGRFEDNYAANSFGIEDRKSVV